MVKRLIGSDTTGTDGSVSIPYTGTGAGLVNLSVETEIDGSIVSEPYPVIDGIIYDTCITGSTTVWVQNGNTGSNTLTDDGRVIQGDSNGSGMFFIKNPSISGMYGWNDPCVIEFKVTEITGAVRFQFYSPSTPATTYSYNYDFTDTGNWKFVYDGTNITVYLNGVQQGNPVAKNFNNTRLGFIAKNTPIPLAK